MEPIRFKTYGGPDGLEQHVIKQTGCKPFSGAGINIRKEKATALLKSVDNTPYYMDDLSNINTVEYTLFGHNGDQSEAEARFNAPLLNEEKTTHIYLYRVRNDGRKKDYLWYGKYNIVNKTVKQCLGKDRIMRDVIILTLKLTS